MRPEQRQSLGPHGLTVTQLGLGGTGFGNMYRAMDEQTARATAAAAWDLGIRYFDTAPLYGYGLSEQRLGVGLAPYERAAFALSTKVGYSLVARPADEPDTTPFTDMPPLKGIFDYSRDAVLRSIDASLARLQTDRIDILMIHDPDEGISLQPNFDPYGASHFDQVMEQTYPILHELRQQKVVGAIGLGMNQWQMLCDFARAGNFDCFLLAGRYTLLEQESGRQLLPLCQEKDIRIIVGGPYNSGILATGAVAGAHYNYAPAPPDILERTQRIQDVCAAHSVPLQAAALQFPFGHPAVATTIPGSRTPEELAANAAFFAFPIPADFWAELQAQSLIDPQAPVPADQT